MKLTCFVIAFSLFAVSVIYISRCKSPEVKCANSTPALNEKIAEAVEIKIEDTKMDIDGNVSAELTIRSLKTVCMSCELVSCNWIYDDGCLSEIAVSWPKLRKIFLLDYDKDVENCPNGEFLWKTEVFQVTGVCLDSCFETTLEFEEFYRSSVNKSHLQFVCKFYVIYQDKDGVWQQQFFIKSFDSLPLGKQTRKGAETRKGAAYRFEGRDPESKIQTHDRKCQLSAGYIEHFQLPPSLMLLQNGVESAA